MVIVINISSKFPIPQNNKRGYKEYNEYDEYKEYDEAFKVVEEALKDETSNEVL